MQNMFELMSSQIEMRYRKAVTAYEQGNFEQGINLAKQAYQLAKAYFDTSYPGYAKILNALAVLYQAMGHWAEAESLFLQCLEIDDRRLGNNHRNDAVTLSNLASLHHARGHFAKAEPLYLQCLDIFERCPGKDYSLYATTLDHLASLYQEMGRFAKAEPLYLQCSEIFEHCLGQDHPHYAITLDHLASLYHAMGRFAEAIPLYQQCLEIFERRLGQDHPHYAQTLNNLAQLYQEMGRFAEAEPLYLQCLGIFECRLSKNHPDYAQTLNNLAQLYQEMGRFVEAESWLLQCLEIGECRLGKNHLRYATTLNNLASLYQEMGRLAEAKPLYRQCLEIRERQLGKDHPHYGQTLNNLAGLYRAMGRQSEAELLYLQCLEIRERQLPQDHPHHATTLDNLASLYGDMGRQSEAESLYRQCLKIRDCKLGKNHPSYATTLNNLAELYRSMGRQSEAEPLYRQCLEIIDRQLGKNHPDYATTLNSLAVLLVATDRLQEALQLMQEAASIEDKILGQIFSISSDTQRLSYLEQKYPQLEGFFSLVTQYFPKAPDAVEIAFNCLLRRKALGAEAAIIQRTAILSDRYRHLAPQLQELQQLDQQISTLIFAVPSSVEQLAAYKSQLAKLYAQKDQLEGNLSRQIPEMNLQKQLENASCDAIASALPEGATLVEFVRFRPCNFKAVRANGDSQWQPARYLAFILPANQPKALQMLDLGEAEPIDKLIRDFRASISGERSFVPDFDEPEADPVPNFSEAAELYEKLIQPLKPYLQKQQRLFLAPDSELSCLAFGILSANGSPLFMEDYALSYLTVGRDLLRFNFPLPAQPTAPLVVANPDFNLAASSNRSPSESNSGATQTKSADADSHPTRAGEFRSCSREFHSPTPSSNPFHSPNREQIYRSIGRGKGQAFNPLPGSSIEGERIAAQLGVTPHLETQALKSLVRRSQSPRILHLSTHGYFQENLPQTPPPEREIFGQQRLQWAGEQNPLARSGLAFAGANTFLRNGKLPPEAENGILTALDATAINLAGTALVVLSACQTGLGNVLVGEGVLGLRRAFVLAGTQTLVMSLWKVPDIATAILMERFYHNLLTEKMGRADALEEAQFYLRDLTITQLRPQWLTQNTIAWIRRRSLLIAEDLEALSAKPDDYRPYSHIKYWGAFICQGNPEAMHGEQLTVGS